MRAIHTQQTTEERKRNSQATRYSPTNSGTDMQISVLVYMIIRDRLVIAISENTTQKKFLQD